MRSGLGLAVFGLITAVSAADILSTSGFQDCGNGEQDVSVSEFHLSFDKDTKELDFIVAGNSKISQNVTGPKIFISRLISSSDKCDSSWGSEVFKFFQPVPVMLFIRLS